MLRQQGYRVLDVANGDEALSLVRQGTGEEVHLLLTDVVMPLMGGRQLAVSGARDRNIPECQGALHLGLRRRVYRAAGVLPDRVGLHP